MNWPRSWCLPVVRPANCTYSSARLIQILKICLWGLLATVLALIVNGPSCSSASGPIIDPLDGQPLRWKMVDADGPAEIKAHWLDAVGGMDRKPCEAMTLVAGNGTRVDVEYRIEPSKVIDDVRATVALQSIRSGPRIGLRICFPRILDPTTRAPKTTVIWGDSHGGRGRWEMLSVSPKSAEIRLMEMALREQFGSTADTRDMYVEAVVVNIYAGAGAYTLRLDEFRVDGLLTVDPSRRAAALRATNSLQMNVDLAADAGASNHRFGISESINSAGNGLSSVSSAFPLGSLTRVIEYNGESLQYLKILGFDGVLLARPPSPAVLREAIENAMLVYAPPPPSRSEPLEPFLNVVAGWYLGTSTDETQLRLAASEQKRIAAMGPVWQRPLLVAPAEAWDRFSGVATSMIYDMPPTFRGLDGGEEVDLLVDQAKRTGRPVIPGLGIATLPPQRLVSQIDGLGQSLGAATVEDYGWRGVWLQTARGLTICPRAVVFRSHWSLESGRELDSRRASVLGYVNHWLKVVGPLVSTCQFRGTLLGSRTDFKLAHLSTGNAEVVIATNRYNPSGTATTNLTSSATTSDPDDDMAPNEATLRFRVPLGANNFAWRITETVVEQLQVTGDATTREIAVDNPDLVEMIVTSNDPAIGGLLDQAIRSNGAAINQHRWNLVSESLMRTREDWQAASGGGLVSRNAIPGDLLRSAARILIDVQPQIGAGEFGPAMRSIRAGDQIALRCELLLRNRLLISGATPQGMPTLLAPGGVMLQLAWLPSLNNAHWTANLLAGGELDDSETLVRTGWTYQTRLESQAIGSVAIEPLIGEQGTGALRIAAHSSGGVPLGGGYAGTVARVSSSPVMFSPGAWVRIQARVKTLGYGGPNQGLLVYDSDAGSEVGTLVRGNSPWQTIVMYRVITREDPLKITFEGIGDGEAIVDSVDISMWQPPQPPPVFRPIGTQN